jgi:hypothetical protein
MSRIALSGNASGTGTFTLASPNSNSDRTINLPDAGGDMVLTTATQTLTNKDIVATQLTGDVAAARITTALNASGSAPIYACRAWVNWDGDTGSGNTIRGSGNVSSVTRNASGNYTVNFTTAMPDANYSAAASCAASFTANSDNRTASVGTFNTGNVGVITQRTDLGTFFNTPVVSVAIFR